MTELNALVALGRGLMDRGYEFVTPTPLTHSRVNARRASSTTPSLRDVFGWSRPSPPGLIPAELIGLMEHAGILEHRGAMVASRLRFSTLDGLIFAHSAYPTTASDSVFFGPDTYRFAAAVRRSVAADPPPRAILDIGCGSGAGGIVAAHRAGNRPFLVLSDINRAALKLARVNAALAGVAACCVAGDVCAPIAAGQRFDLIVANPPYLVDPEHRLYRDGGGPLGAALSLRILREAIGLLMPGGRLVLYTGAAIIGGRDPFRDETTAILQEAGLAHDYAELDPDVFGEELEAGPYRNAERIAAVALTARARPESDI
ncbi:MAG: class I SAM-dependent methyltransferase [Alphaproteobacteria bacterium]|nr:class I SAM-dependent methyltransferase [Alphaproteobacteria bacterium]